MQTKAIKEKIKSVGNIQKITKTMEMVSVAKMRKATTRAIAAQPCAGHAAAMLRHIALEGGSNHPYVTTRAGETNKTLILIIASNKGLCGGYNVNVNKQVSAYKKTQEKGHEFVAITIGRQAELIARRNKIEIKASFTEFRNILEESDVRALTKMILEAYVADESIGQVMVAHTAFIKMMDYRATMSPMLPLNADQVFELYGHKDSVESKAEYQFEPSLDALVEAVIPGMLQSLIIHLLSEASASEHSSRMLAMQNASDNAGRMKDDLKLSFNRARQAGITQEISEIINASESMGS